MKARLWTVGACVSVLSFGGTPALGAPSDGQLGGAPMTSAASSTCPAGVPVTGVSGRTYNLNGNWIVGSAGVQCADSEPATGTLGDPASPDQGRTSCDAGQVAVGIYGREGDFVDQLGLRCRAADLTGAVVSSLSAYGGVGGAPDGPYDCPDRQWLTGLTGSVTPGDHDLSTVRHLVIQCSAPVPAGDGRLGAPLGSPTASTSCYPGVGVVSVRVRNDNFNEDPIVAGATAICQGGSPASGDIGTFGEPHAFTSCPAGQVAVGITGREGDFVYHLALRCRAASLTGPTDVGTLVGGVGGSPDGPYECPEGQQLQELTGSTTFTDTTVRHLEIVCGVPNDSDSDGDFDYADNCSTVANPGQEDLDGDGRGNACDDAHPGDGRLGGDRKLPAVSFCPAGKAVTAVSGPVVGDPGVVASASVSCEDGAASSGTIGWGLVENVPSTSCPAGQVAVGISGREDALLNQIALRCLPTSLTGGVTTALAIGGNGGVPDGPYDCPQGQQLRGLSGSQQPYGTLSHVEIVCELRSRPVTPQPTPTPGPPTITVQPSASWKATRAYTLVRKLTIAGIPAGATVSATCRGKRRSCAFRRKEFSRTANGTANLLSAFKKRRLAVGTVIKIRVAMPGAIGAVITYTVRKGQRPSTLTQCLPVGASKPVSCSN